MLDVRDGDAIIVSISKSMVSLVILIDGGHVGDTDTILAELEPVLGKFAKKAPDLIICTHYDNDHIGGLYKIIEYYGASISEVWMHQTSCVFHPNQEEDEQDWHQSFYSILPSANDQYLTGGEGIRNSEEDDPYFQLVLRTLQQEQDLVALIKSLNIPLKQPIAASCEYLDWPELEVIGPTREYYRKLFPDHFDGVAFVQDEAEALRSEDLMMAENIDISPCQALDNLPKAKVTAPNLNSAILLIKLNGRKFLFTGDAGVESFYAIPDYQLLLADLYWLKVPHHGSKNNISADLIDLMKPTYSFISGNKHISKAVVGCLAKKGSIVSTTRDNAAHLVFSEVL